MKKYKVNIVYDFTDDPWGGGNQFLKALREELRKMSVYADILDDADVFLFNSHHSIIKVFKYKIKYPEKVFIHRLDGPVSLVRGDFKLDRKIFKVNRLVANGTIFQSKWSRNKSNESGFKTDKPLKVIINAPDKLFFNLNRKSKVDKNKIKLIATSWSSNWKKGFRYYKYMDENLDFKKFIFTFVGNSPVRFKKIKQILPVKSKKLSEILKKHDIYLAFSEDDPCSNSLIEALHCGLPAVFLNSGGHSEIVGNGGEKVSKKEEIFNALNKIVKNYNYYLNNINLPDIATVAKEYYEFMEEVYEIKKATATGILKNFKNILEIMAYFEKLNLLLFLKRKKCIIKKLLFYKNE